MYNDRIKICHLLCDFDPLVYIYIQQNKFYHLSLNFAKKNCMNNRNDVIQHTCDTLPIEGVMITRIHILQLLKCSF